MKRGILQIVAVFLMVASAGLWLGLSAASAQGPTDQGMSQEQWQLFRKFVFDKQLGLDQPGLRSGSGSSLQAAQIGAAALVSVTGRVVDPSGTGVADAQIFANRVTPFTSPGSVCPIGSGTGTPTPTASPTLTPTPFGTPMPPDVAPDFVGVTTGADGSFALSLSTGEWFLSANKPGLLAGAASNQRLQVQSSNITTVTLTLLPPTNVISGIVRNPNGTPVTSTFDLSLSGFGRRGGDASFEFFSTSGTVVSSTGAYSLAVVPASWDIFSPFVFGSNAVRTGVANISVTQGVNPNVDLTLRSPDAAISGVVVNDLGTPVPRANIGANLIYSATQPNATTAFSSTTSVADGTFNLPLFAGTWNISVFTRTETTGFVEPANLQLTAPASGQTITLLREIHCIQGRVTDPSGTPVAGAFITGRHQPAGQPYFYTAFGTADAAGNYALPVGPGTWDVRASTQVTFSASLTRTASVPPDQTGVDLQLQTATTTTPTATGTVPSGNTATPTATGTTPSGNTATATASPSPSATRVVGSPTATYTATPEGTAAQKVFMPLIVKSSGGW